MELKSNRTFTDCIVAPVMEIVESDEYSYGDLAWLTMDNLNLTGFNLEQCNITYLNRNNRIEGLKVAREEEPGIYSYNKQMIRNKNSLNEATVPFQQYGSIIPMAMDTVTAEKDQTISLILTINIPHHRELPYVVFTAAFVTNEKTSKNELLNFAKQHIETYSEITGIEFVKTMFAWDMQTIKRARGTGVICIPFLRQ